MTGWWGSVCLAGGCIPEWAAGKQAGIGQWSIHGGEEDSEVDPNTEQM